MTKENGFFRMLLKLAIPISLQHFVTFAVGFADNLMMGTLGEYSISGVFMGNQAQIFLQMFAAGISSALTILCAQYWGKRDGNGVKILSGIAFRITVVLGAVLWAVSYFFPGWLIGLFTPDAGTIAEGVKYIRILSFSYVFFMISQTLIATMQSVGTPKIGFYSSLAALVVNVGMNWVLIFGKLGFPAMGVAGAAIATVISRVVETLVVSFYVFKLDRKIRLKLKDLFTSNSLLFRDFLRYGMPVVLAMVVWGVNTLAQNAIIGQFRAEAITAISITNMLHQLVYVFMLGLSAALGIITSMTVGAGEFGKMKQYAIKAQVFFLYMGLTMGLFVFLIKDLFISLYNVEPATVEVTRQFLIILAVSVVGSFYQAALLGGLVKSGGNTSFTLKNDTIFVFGVVLPSALIAMHVFHAPVWVVFICLKSDQMLKCFVAVVVIKPVQMDAQSHEGLYGGAC